MALFNLQNGFFTSSEWKRNFSSYFAVLMDGNHNSNRHHQSSHLVSFSLSTFTIWMWVKGACTWNSPIYIVVGIEKAKWLNHCALLCFWTLSSSTSALSTLRRHVIGEFYCANYIFDISFHIQLLLTRLFSMRRLQSGLAGSMVSVYAPQHTLFSLPLTLFLSFSLTHTHFLLLLYVVNLQLI